MRALMRRAGMPLALVLGAAVLSGCSLGSLEVRAGVQEPRSAATIEITPTAASGAPVAPSAPLVVSAKAGRLSQVTVRGPHGSVPGTLSTDGLSFTVPGGSMDYATAYTVDAVAVDRVGLVTHTTSTVRTVAPSLFLSYVVSPRDGATVGVGMPITLHLDHKLRNDSSKAAFERVLSVTVDGQRVAGAWNWVAANVVEYRPANFWPGHATVTVTGALKGHRFTTSVWGKTDVSSTFHTGAMMISTVDIVTDTMTVTSDGEVLRVVPITTGKSGFETRGGIKVIEGKERRRIMDAATGGTDPTDPEYYRLEVEYAMRITNSGEFLHAAPWSVRHQGHENVSHGCTGMSTADAAWFYGLSRIGDVVIYTGSARPLEPGNGITVWNDTFADWSKGSALA